MYTGSPELQAILPELAEALRENASAVLCAPPGAGKTTAVPPYLLERLFPRVEDGKIVMLEPRRIAARACAARIAELRGEKPGETVGYRTRLDTRVSGRTRIEIVTEGILTRMLQSDPDLPGISLVIFDEFHERSVQADLALTLALESRAALGLGLKILVMSATLDSERVSALLDGAPVFACEGRLFPVSTVYQPRRNRFAPLEDSVESAVKNALAETDRDVLVFLPGSGEIRRAQKKLEQSLPEAVAVRPLYGDLPPELQDEAIAPGPSGTRKVILATPVAETSLTIEGVRAVVDSGLRRTGVFSPSTGMQHLETRTISLASAEQRRGRAGRVAPGLCIRLWAQEEESRRIPFDPPEILECDPVPLALELAGWGARPEEIASMRWLDPPPRAKLEGAFALLRELGAVDSSGGITPHGRAMLRLGIHPRTAHAVLRSEELFRGGCTAALAAAILEERGLPAGETCDMRDRISAVLRLNHPAAKRILFSAEKAARAAGIRSFHADCALAGPVLALAWPDRIACRRPGRTGEYTLSRGSGAKLRVTDHLANETLLAAAEVGGEGSIQTIFTAAPIAFGDLLKYLPGLVEEDFEAGWDQERGIVSAERITRIGKAVYSARPAAGDAPEETLVRGLVEGVRRTGFHVLPFGKSENNLRSRVNFLRRSLPEEEGKRFPDFSEEGLMNTLEEWLAPHLGGMTRLEQLKRLNFHEILENLLDYPLRRRLEEEAPEKIRVPSGSMIRLDYETPDGIPLLPVKLQEIFGMLDTPRIAGGRIAVAVRMLSPAMRPVQTTRDLRNFWTGSYALVRKDMRGRYPKHFWPENPLDAEPSRRTTKPRV